MTIQTRYSFVGCCAAAALALCAGQASAQCGGAGPDLVVGDLNGVTSYTATGGFAALSLGTTSCNIGSVNVQWNACNSVTHPVIGGNLYRYTTVNGATRMEQVGQSWLKHAFEALTGSICCSCNGQGGSVLGVGCSDPYTAARNGSQSGLGPRSTVNAFTGTYPASTCNQHPSSTGNFGRLEVALTDCVTTAGGTNATTRYFGESQYINHDDATFTDASHAAGSLGNNNASSREISVTVTGSPATNATFGFVGNTERYKSAIEKWHDLDPQVVQTTAIVPGEGKFIVCSRVTAIPGNLYHYEYAVYNMNSDRSAGSISMPFSDAVGATNIGFHGVIYRGGDGVVYGTNYDGTAWANSKTNGVMSWSTTPYATSQNANAIRWGTTYNFRFDTPLSPVHGNIAIGLWKPGAVTSVSADGLIPGQPPCGSADFNHDGDIGTDADIQAFFSCLGGDCCQACGSVDFNGDGDYGTDSDIEAFFRVLGGGNC